MNKLEQLKHAMKNPPPERLAKIEYKSHMYQAFGISFVCIILIAKGMWYIIFAFVFGLGISYSQGMTAFQKYNMIMSMIKPEAIEDYEKDISFTRRRSKIIESVMGKKASWVSIIAAVVATVLVVDPTMSRWILMLVYPLCIAFIYIISYFFIAYWMSYLVYKKRIKSEGSEE